MRFTRWVLVFAFLLFAAVAEAKITIGSISGVSNVEITSGRYIVYGGTVGNFLGSCNTTETCNNCDGTGLTACNPKRVKNTTTITITYSSDTLTGNAILSTSAGASATSNGTTSIAKNGTQTLTFTWETVCGLFSAASTNCETTTATGVDVNQAVVLRVGVDSSASSDGKLDGVNDDYVEISFKVQRSMGNTVSAVTAGTSSAATNGIYGWTVYPGDAKVYLEGPLQDEDPMDAWDGFPSSANGILYKNVLVYYVKNKVCSGINATTFSNATPNYATLSIGSDGNLPENRIFGLENEVDYTFTIGLEDQAGNRGLFYDISAGTNCTHNRQDARPGEVFGLLEEQQNCFIATAAWGTPFDHHIQTFRDFRDRFLITYEWGRKFVSWYYNEGPKFAKMIAKSESARGLTRAALYPLWGFAKLSLMIGFEAALVVALALLASLIVILRMPAYRPARLIRWKRR